MSKQEMFQFLKDRSVGVVATELSNGSPHCAVVDYIFIESAEIILIQTDIDSRKCEKIKEDGFTNASFVTGFSDSTAQLNGVLVKSLDLTYSEQYFSRFPEKKEKYPQDIILVFVPDWYRFTRWTNEGKKMCTVHGI